MGWCSGRGAGWKLKLVLARTKWFEQECRALDGATPEYKSTSVGDIAGLNRTVLG